MRTHLLVVEMEAEDITTEEVIEMVKGGIEWNMGQDTGDVFVKEGDSVATREWKAGRYDSIMKDIVAWKAGEIPLDSGESL